VPLIWIGCLLFASQKHQQHNIQSLCEHKEKTEEEHILLGEMKRHVNIFVRNIFGKNSLPNQINRRFYPSPKDLRGMIDRRRRKIIQGLLDQEVLSVSFISTTLYTPSSTKE
jgi:hypothetical protein